ncbi:MAG: pilus assembly protein PilM [Enterococcus sp.]|nr:pilus assembly protein PilM [Enterococcus sp.]
MPKKQKTFVGLDIGSTRIRGVEATMSGGKPQIIGIASLALDDGIVESGEIKDIPEFARALKSLWKQGKFTAKDVRIVINSENNIAKLTSVSDEIDFDKTLPFKLKKVEVFNVDDFYLSYHTIRKYTVQEADTSRVEGYRVVPMRDIFLAGSKRVSIDSLVTALDSADLRPLSVDIAPLALIRAESLEGIQELRDDSIDIHINVGGDMTTIVISSLDQPVYMRITDIGGNTITDAIARELDIDYAYANKLKLETVSMKPNLVKRAPGANSIFADDEAPEETPQYTQDQLDAFDVVTDEISAIISNINRTIIYFIEQNQLGLGDDIGTVYVSGGTAAFDQIIRRLTHEIGANRTILSNPISILSEKKMIKSSIADKFLEREHEYTLAVGAVLGHGGQIND